MSSAMSTASTAVCVLGMNRSGTSATTGLLHLLGVNLGRNLMKPGPDNPKGFWEEFDIANGHVGLLETIDSYSDDTQPLPEGWVDRPEVAKYREYFKNILQKEFSGSALWGFKDPRACLLLPFWRTIFEEVHASPRYILVVRNPSEIAASMNERGGYSYNQLLLSTLLHMLMAELHTRGGRRVVAPYSELLADWRKQANHIGSVLGITWPNPPEKIAGQAADFLDSNMRHHVSKDSGSAAKAVAEHGADPRIAGWVFGAYDILTAAASDPAKIDQAALDRISAEMQADRVQLAAWRAPRSNKDRITKVQTMAARLDQDLKRLIKENQELRNRLSK
jgi:hypothetical protein